jgi:2-oxoglutarate ferredoxin oxidoreductase subunit beta
MTSLLNPNRPPVFCPGCSHDRVLKAVDTAFQQLGLVGSDAVVVSDIGCSGLFDTFFNTHAVHGLHGRVLTYAAGIKLARPDMRVMATIGDGGLGIGGAHFLAACRRNLDITLLVLNNFNFGMTGGQFSSTTPPDARLSSGFLNQLEKPMDVASLAAVAGAPAVWRISAYDHQLVATIAEAVDYCGFSVVDIWGVCPGRYVKRNRLNPGLIDEAMENSPPFRDNLAANIRTEYGRAYREQAQNSTAVIPGIEVKPKFKPPIGGRYEVVILGSAGQRVQTAGRILAVAGALSGLHISQKSEYNITVLRGPSSTELVFDVNPVDFKGIRNPDIVIAIGPEGVKSRESIFGLLDESALVIHAADLSVPETGASRLSVDFSSQQIKGADRALASLGILAQTNRFIDMEILIAGLSQLFDKQRLDKALDLVREVRSG